MPDTPSPRATARIHRVALLILLLLGMTSVPQRAQADETIAVARAAQADQSAVVLVELRAEPVGKIYADALAGTATPSDQARAAVARATSAQLRVVRLQQQAVAARLMSAPFRATEIYRVQRVMNAIAVRVDSGQLNALRRLPGVKSVQPLTLEYPTSNSIPFIGAPQLWEGSVGLGQTLTGAGISIGVIDTGIDYQHANFGGSGLLTDYQANDRTTNADALFPTAKVVGGADFAGDAYTGSNAPTPDPDPMDCNGHGTHVAGTAAGLGVQADGTTFPGPYTTAAPFGALRIAPGVAPGAQLYALRVFGCTGGTILTVQAIEWALDPNGDSDLSDRLDVINLSLGSEFGGPTSATTVAAENAARAGVIVVASAGNSGDTAFITGSPGVSGRTISVAAVADDGIAAVRLQVTAPPTIAGGYAATAAAFGPAPSGQSASIIEALDAADGSGPLTTDACSALSNQAALAGNIALIDRGTCGFQQKVANAQAAGAIGAIIINNVVGDPYPPVMGATAGQPAITIPAIAIARDDGIAIRSQIVGGVSATLASTTAADTLASFSSRGPRLGAPTILKPDIAAPGVSIISAQTGVTCTAGNCLRPDASGYLPDSQPLTISGTSMASPHIAGGMALLRQQRPTWTVEELKALAMNTALNTVTIGADGSGHTFSVSRAGAGRVDLAASAQSQVIAFNADDPGLVSVVFDPEVVGVTTQTRRIRIVNHGATDATYDLAVSPILSAPGVSFSLPGGGSVTIPAGQSATIDVQMSADASQMDHTKDPTVTPTQAAPGSLAGLGSLSRHWLTESAGFVTLSAGGQTRLQVPIAVAPRPASTMQGQGVIATGGAPTGSTTIPLSGADVCSGTLGAGPTCVGSFPTDMVSLVTPLELQVVSPRDASLPGYLDLQYGGVAYDPASGLVLFGVSTWDDWSTPTEVAFNIYVDSNSDGSYDRIVFNSNPGTISSRLLGGSGTAQDSFITAIFNTGTNGISVGGAGQYVNRVSAATIDSALFRTNVMFLAATPAQLGISGSFRYRIETCPGSAPLCGALSGFSADAAVGPYAWNYNAQGLSFSGAHLVFNLNGAALPVTWNSANMATNGSLGALLLHHHNRAGMRAQPVALEGAQVADIAIDLSAAPASPARGQSVTLTLTASNSGPNAASGVVASSPLPPGLTYVSDDSGGAYNPTTGEWAVGALPASGSATIAIVATVAETGEAVGAAQIGAASPIDTNPANNRDSVTIAVPRESDLSVTMQASSAAALVGETITYTMTVTNQGGDPAYSLAPTQSFPAGGVTISSASASQGVFDQSSGVWSIASLGQGISATLTLAVTPIASGDLTNTGAVALSGDPDSANDSDSATVNVSGRATAASISLAPASVTPGQSSLATIIITDTEPSGSPTSPTGTVTLSDPLSGTTYTPSASCTLAPVVGASGQSSCQISVTPTALGQHTITASYGGSTTHLASSGGGVVTVAPDSAPTTYRISLPLVVRDATPVDLPHAGAQLDQPMPIAWVAESRLG